MKANIQEKIPQNNFESGDLVVYHKNSIKFIVLVDEMLSTSFTGTVVYIVSQGNYDPHYVGRYRRDWEKPYFKKYHGTLTMEQE